MAHVVTVFRAIPLTCCPHMRRSTVDWTDTKPAVETTCFPSLSQTRICQRWALVPLPCVLGKPQNSVRKLGKLSQCLVA